MTKLDLFSPFRSQYAAEEVANQGPKHWRSLQHKARDPEVAEYTTREFLQGVNESTGMQRRDMLKLMGASLALAGAGSACVRRAEDEILPYTKQPEDIIPGVPLMYATTLPTPWGAVGILAESHEGRPTKLEGNPEHPASLGALDATSQAAVLQMYDPDRSRAPQQGANKSDWAKWDAFAKSHFDGLAGAAGKGLVFLLDENNSPTVQRLQKELQGRFPEAKFFSWSAVSTLSADQGTELVFGANTRVRYNLDKADVILSVDSDFLQHGADFLPISRAFGGRRRIMNASEAEKMNRLYAVEGAFTITGSNADHRVRVPSARMAEFLKAVVAALLDAGVVVPAALGGDAAKAKLVEAVKTDYKLAGKNEKFIPALVKDLQSKAGKSVILVGERQPAAVHALGHIANLLLGNYTEAGDAVGTVLQTAANPVATNRSLKALVELLNSGGVDTLVSFAENPVFTAPGALKFVDAYKKAKTTIHLGLYADETAAVSTWHVPLAHSLEAWGDLVSFTGTPSLVQPLILPLWNARSNIEVLAQIAGLPETDGLSLVRKTWQDKLGTDKSWRRAVHDGVIPSAQNIERYPNAVWSALTALSNAPTALADALGKLAKPAGDTEVVFTFGAMLDGRMSNIAWLQELPDSMSKLCWDNAALVSPALANKMGLNSQVRDNNYIADVVTISVAGASLDIPTFVMPGLAENTIVVSLGYGRKAAGFIGNDVGVNAFILQDDDGNLFRSDAKITSKNETRVLCSTQDYFALDGGDPFQKMQGKPLVSGIAYAEDKKNKNEHADKPRALVRGATLKQYEEEPLFAKEKNIEEKLLEGKKRVNTTHPEKPVQMTDSWPYEGQQWGMVIDLTSCTGCNACVTACQSENNIPVVGRQQVLVGREMHWNRIDRYFSGDVDQPEAAHQPVACMHCENAPCEPVCPVAATVHDEEGINTMVYNRCLGTRYCANNCPYKVRRFNFKDFTSTGNMYVDPVLKERNRTLKMQRNPDVTVRYRGVIEKCSYCVQRVQEAKIKAKRAGQDSKNLPDGSIVPACGQTCPTQAITFGNINDKNSRVSLMKLVDRNYEMLSELNIRPRTTYLAKLRNPNPELV